MAKVKLINARLAFPDLFEATQYEGQGKFRYNATFLIVPGSANDIAVQKAIQETGLEYYEKKWKAQYESIKGNPQKFCYQPGDAKEYDGYQGLMVLSAHRQQTDGRVVVIDADKSPLTAADGKPYGGCYVNATVGFFGYKQGGIGAGLTAVQFAKHGDAFSGAGTGRLEDFDSLEEGADAESLV